MRIYNTLFPNFLHLAVDFFNFLIDFPVQFSLLNIFLMNSFEGNFGINIDKVINFFIL